MVRSWTFYCMENSLYNEKSRWMSKLCMRRMVCDHFSIFVSDTVMELRSFFSTKCRYNDDNWLWKFFPPWFLLFCHPEPLSPEGGRVTKEILKNAGGSLLFFVKTLSVGNKLWNFNCSRGTCSTTCMSIFMVLGHF